MRVEKKCACGKTYFPRQADLDRGWGKSCSKSCAAKRTNKKTGNYKRFCNNKSTYEEDPDQEYYDALSDIENTWDGHKECL